AALALGMMGASASAPLLVRVAADPSQETRLRVHATIGLGMLRDGSATGKLLALLARPDEAEVQVAAAMALGLAGDGTAAAALAGLTDSPAAPDPVRVAAVSALGKLGVDQVNGRSVVAMLGRRLLTDRDDDVRRAAALVLRRHPAADEARSTLERAARQDRDAVTRGFAMLSLAEVVHARGISEERRAAHGLLERALRFGSDREFGYAAIALGLLGRGDPGLAAPLRAAFEGASTGSDKAACAVALGLLGDTASCKRIADAVSADGVDPDVRGYCCVALGLLGRDDPGVVSFLRDLVERAHVPELRAAASLALAKLGDRSAIPTLRRAIEDRNRYFQMSATIALGYFRDPETVKDLVAHYRHESNPEARAITIVALGYIGDRGTLPALRELALDFDYLVACDRLPAVDQILRLF
ncbi:MAG: HEAT repeat domain-containing protein, partial [Planctomycetales bacterium]|nr:HEAT repeat domain-containing protein [Planctomycetales bacterium]